MGDQIIVVCRGRFEDLPVVRTVTIGLRTLGFSVGLVVSTINERNRSDLEGKGVRVRNVFTGRARTGVLGKLRDTLEFRREAWREVESVGEMVLWIASGDTALALGDRLKRYRYVLQLNELYDRTWHYRAFLRTLAEHASCVVVPERCRAAILHYWFSLNSLPEVLPNYPTVQERVRGQDLPSDSVKEILGRMYQGVTPKIVIYQGHIARDRDCRVVAQAVYELGRPWRFVAMGIDHKFMNLVRVVCPSVIQIDPIPSPDHLTVTSHAHIGVVVYARDSLNSLFCAPNKIWEYSCFGIPMLCANLPGLLSTVGLAEAGLCIDLQSVPVAADALLRIDREYAVYSANALRMYERVDVGKILSAVIRRVFQT